MTKTQEWIFRHLIGKDWTSPTQIGRAYGDFKHGTVKWHNYHSAWASPKCLKLTAAGVLERNDKGHYRVSRDEYDPTPWCMGCMSMTQSGCNCGPIAKNN